MKASAVLLTITQVLASLPLELLSVAIAVQGEDLYSVVLQVTPAKLTTPTMTVEELGELASDSSDGVSLVEDGRIAVVGTLPAVIASIQEAAAPTLPQEVLDVLIDDMDTTHKIQAIKRYREVTGEGLRESKEAVEAYLKYRETAKYMRLNSSPDEVRIVHVEQRIMQQVQDETSLALHFADIDQEGL